MPPSNTLFLIDLLFSQVTQFKMPFFKQEILDTTDIGRYGAPQQMVQRTRGLTHELNDRKFN
jgi:hypothetical protein